MFELPGLDGVRMVINREVVEGRAKPLYIYSERRGRSSSAAATALAPDRPRLRSRRCNGLRRSP